MNHIYLFPETKQVACRLIVAYRVLSYLSYWNFITMLYVDWELHRFYTQFVMTPALCRDLPICLSRPWRL
ncbi:hypothetical protein VN97_g10486 [Penicillium thymicola]|uniref:Uncharacterized protein n=1 Tax=Penicillium thymicola TaxID=293382 RepID=A0AAI9T914_PENTH|nr:hypothetical protein VN97_g10486 [Penicillium thymicola]